MGFFTENMMTYTLEIVMRPPKCLGKYHQCIMSISDGCEGLPKMRLLMVTWGSFVEG